jgi:hypothetical protein
MRTDAWKSRFDQLDASLKVYKDARKIVWEQLLDMTTAILARVRCSLVRTMDSPAGTNITYLLPALDQLGTPLQVNNGRLKTGCGPPPCRPRYARKATSRGGKHTQKML